MIYYKQLSGVTAPEGAPGITKTPDGLAIGFIPGWSMLLDPAYLTAADRVRNRALPKNIGINTSGVINLGSFANGQPAFLPTAANLMRINVDATISPDAWSVFTVARYVENNSGKGLVINPRIEQGGVIAPQIGFNASGANAIIWENSLTSEGQPQRLSAPVNLSGRTQPALVMFTSSVRDGLRIFVDGDLIAAAPDDKRPLDFGFGTGQWDVFRRMRSRWGMTGVLNLDLGWAEHAGYRRLIEGVMMQRYGIA